MTAAPVQKTQMWTCTIGPERMVLVPSTSTAMRSLASTAMATSAATKRASAQVLAGTCRRVSTSSASRSVTRPQPRLMLSVRRPPRVRRNR